MGAGDENRTPLNVQQIITGEIGKSEGGITHIPEKEYFPSLRLCAAEQIRTYIYLYMYLPT